MIYRILQIVLFILVTDTLSAQSYTIKNISIVGNDKTRESVITRELLFTEGKTYSIDSLNSLVLVSENRLLNLNLFNSASVSINYQQDSSTGTVYIKVVEKWYFWPLPFVEFSDRNFNVWQNRQFNSNRVNYGLYSFNYNLFGLNHTLKTNLKTGYNKELGLEYRIPFISQKSQWGIKAQFKYESQNEVWYETQNDSLQFFKNGKNNLIKNSDANLEFTKRMTPFVRVYYGLGFKYSQLDTSVPTNEYFINNQRFQRNYGLQARIEVDKRDNIYYPINGSFLSLGIGGNMWQNTTTEPNIGIKVKAQRFDKVAKNLYTAVSFYTKFNSNLDPPYVDRKILGYDEIIRGFEHYVIDGNFGWKGNLALRYKLVQSDIKLDFIPMSNYQILPLKIFAEFYGDGGYVDHERPHPSNKLLSSFLYSGGIGINTLFYNDRLLRFEYSLNSLREGGFFVHFKKAI